MLGSTLARMYTTPPRVVTAGLTHTSGVFVVSLAAVSQCMQRDCPVVQRTNNNNNNDNNNDNNDNNNNDNNDDNNDNNNDNDTVYRALYLVYCL